MTHFYTMIPILLKCGGFIFIKPSYDLLDHANREMLREWYNGIAMFNINL